MNTPVANRDQFEHDSVPYADSRIARAAFTPTERGRIVAFTHSHGHYQMTLDIGGQPQTLADPFLPTLFTRAKRLLDLVAELPTDARFKEAA